jgi:hypothetical protein
VRKKSGKSFGKILMLFFKSAMFCRARCGVVYADFFPL